MVAKAKQINLRKRARNKNEKLRQEQKEKKAINTHKFIPEIFFKKEIKAKDLGNIIS